LHVLSVAATSSKPPETIKPKYTKPGQPDVGVMVWADRGIRIDWPNLQIDVGTGSRRS